MPGTVQVMATGGLSFPKMGTDGLGHRLVQRLGHSMHPLYPALTPLRGSHPAEGQLAGMHVTATADSLWCSMQSKLENYIEQARIGQSLRRFDTYHCQSFMLIICLPESD